MNKFIKIFTMFFLISFNSTLYADAPGPVNLSLKGIVDWVRFFQFVEYGTSLPTTPSTRGVWYILWVNGEPALYWSNGSEWVPFVSAGVQADSVDTQALVDGAVTTPKLANSAVTEDKLANNAVTTNKIAENAITGTKFANNSITSAKLAPLSVTNDKLANYAVTGMKIAEGSITSSKLEGTISDKNITLNNGSVANPSLNFKSDNFTGLSYYSASSSMNISIGGQLRESLMNHEKDFFEMTDGVNIYENSDDHLSLKSDDISFINNEIEFSLSLNDGFIASGSIIPSKDLTFDLGSSTAKWNNLFVDDILADNASSTNLQIKNIKLDNGSIYPLTTGTGEVGTSTYKFKSGEFVTLNSSNLMPSDNNSNIGTNTSKFSDIWTYNSNVDKIYFNREINSYAYLERGNLAGNPQLKSSMDLIPSSDNTLNIGRENLVWKTLKVNNASITQNLSVAKITASETVETTYLNAITASFTNLNINNNLEVNGIASVTSLLVNGEPVSSSIKFPRGTLSVDVDCGKYSLRSLGKDLVLFSDAFMMIDYNVTDNGNYFNFKSGNASPVVMVMDSEIASLTSLTIRLDYENIMSENSESILFELENTYADHNITLYALNKKLYLCIDDIDELMDFDYDGYDWTKEHNIYLTVSIENNNIYYGLNIDGVEVCHNSNPITFTQFDIDRIKIGAGYGSGAYYKIAKDYNAKYRRIQIYPYKLSLKEMTSIPLLQPIVDQQRELSKNMTKCPYYTLGEPSTLIGGDFNEGEGFFGEVTGDKFIYPWEVLGQLWGMDMNIIDTKAKFIASFTDVFGSNIKYTFTGGSYTALGVSDNLEVEWLKFYDHGKIIFIPKRPLLNNITWNEINNVLANCAVGKEIKIDLRRTNTSIDSTYSNGNLISVRCRLMTGGNIQPWIYGNVNERGVTDNALGMGSEWNRLMYRICEQIPSDTFAGAMQGYSGGKQLGDNWFNFTGSDLGFGASNDLGRVSFTQEFCYYQNTAFVLLRAADYGVGLVAYTTPSYRYTPRGFRPALVLEVLSQ